MKTKLLFTFFIISFLSSYSQSNYPGNGNSGFGDPIGSSNLNINDDGTTITFTITKGTGDFNDALVLYISNGSAGRTVIDNNVDDFADPLRRAISNANDQGNGTTINFPAGFEATHAIALDTSFGGLWSIPNSGMIGSNGLVFVDSVNSDLASSTQASFTFSLDWSELGLTGADSFDFVGIYLNAGNAFTSDEGYGDGINPGNPGGGTITYTASRRYSNTLGLDDFKTNVSISYINNNKTLKINGYNGNATIKTFDIYGRLLQNIENTFIQNNFTKEINLPQNQLSFIVIEGEHFNKTLKVIAH